MSQFLFHVILMGFISLANSQQPVKESAKRCLDEKCQKQLFSSPVTRPYVSTHQDFLSYKPGQRITVYGVAFGDRPDLWEGELDGKRGYFFANHVDKTPFVTFVRQAVGSGLDFFVIKRDGSNSVLRMETAKGALRQVAEGFLPDVQWDQKDQKSAEKVETSPEQDPLLTSNPLSRRKSQPTAVDKPQQSGQNANTEVNPGPAAENSKNSGQNPNVGVTPMPALEATTSPLAQRIQRLRQNQEQQPQKVVEAQIPPPQQQEPQIINSVDNFPPPEKILENFEDTNKSADDEPQGFQWPELLQQFTHFSESELKDLDWLLTQSSDVAERQELIDFVVYQLGIDRKVDDILEEAKGFVVTNYLDRNSDSGIGIQNSIDASNVDLEASPKTEPPMGSPVPQETPIVQPPVLSEDASKINPTETVKNSKIENLEISQQEPPKIVEQEAKVAARTLPPLSTTQASAGQTLPPTTAVPINLQKMPKEEEKIVPITENITKVAQEILPSATTVSPSAIDSNFLRRAEQPPPIVAEGNLAGIQSSSIPPEVTPATPASLEKNEKPLLPQLTTEKSIPVPNVNEASPSLIKEGQKPIESQFAAEIPKTTPIVEKNDQGIPSPIEGVHQPHLIPENDSEISTGNHPEPTKESSNPNAELNDPKKPNLPSTPEIKIEPSATLPIPKPSEPTPDLNANANLTEEPKTIPQTPPPPKDTKNTVTPTHVHGPGCDHDHGPPATAWSHIDKLLDNDPFKAPALPTLPSWPLDDTQAIPPTDTLPVTTPAPNPNVKEGAAKAGFGGHWSQLHHGHSHGHGNSHEDHGHAHDDHGHSHGNEGHFHDHSHDGHSHGHSHEIHGHSHEEQQREPEPMDPYLNLETTDPFLNAEIRSLGQEYCVKEGGCGPDAIPVDSPPPVPKTFGQKVKEFLRNGREKLQPIARILRVILRNIKFWIVPKDFQDEIGEREIFLTLLTLILAIFYLLSRNFSVKNERKYDLNLRKFAEMTQKLRILELENKKLQEENEKGGVPVGGGHHGVDPDLEKALKKAQECADQLKIELQESKLDRDQLRDSNSHLETENNSFRTKMEDLGAKLLENEEKLADLETTARIHAQCGEEIVELRTTCEFARERTAKLEADLELRNAETLDLERQREEIRDELRDMKRKLAHEVEKFDEKVREIADLEEELRKKEKEIEILKDSVAALEAEPGLKGEEFDAEDSSGWDVDLEDAAAKRKERLEQFLDVAKLRAELKSANAEMERMKSALGAENDARRQAERQMAAERVQSEEAQSNYRELEKKFLQTETKLTCLTEYFQKKEGELQKQLGAMELLTQKHKNELGGHDEETRRLKDENVDLQRMVTDLKRDIQDRDREFSKFRQETERFKHENWRGARHLEQERDSLKAENNYLRRRLADVEKSHVSGSMAEVQDATSNNSSDAELAALSAARTSSPSAGILDDMPPPPPPNLFMGPPPTASPFFGPPSDYWSGDDGFEFGPPQFGMPPIRRSQRRTRSRGARGGDRRSPSPGGYAYDDMAPPRRPGGHRSKSRGRRSEGGGYHSPPSDAEMRGPMRLAPSGVAPPALKSAIRNGGNNTGLPKSDSSFDSPPDRPPIMERRTPKGKSGRV